MDKGTIKQQLAQHSVAIISLVIAIVALLYTAWREEETEKNRNIRTAAFETLKHLGELQILVNSIHYQATPSLGDPILGWGHIALISDMGSLLPQPVPEQVQKLVAVWGTEWQEVGKEEAAVTQISTEIDYSRKEVLHVLHHLR